MLKSKLFLTFTFILTLLASCKSPWELPEAFILNFTSLRDSHALPLTPTASPGVSGICHFYLTKKKELGPCLQESGSSDYLVKYGYKYCDLFEHKSKQWQDERTPWVERTILCLQAELDKIKGPISSEKLEDLAFDSHPKCYRKSGFCSLRVDQQLSILWQALSLDVVSMPLRSAYQGFKLIRECLSISTASS